MKQLIKSVLRQKLSMFFGYLFFISIPFNTRVIYKPEHAYIEGYFAYYLAYFFYLSDFLFIAWLISYLYENVKRFHGYNILRKPPFWLVLGILSIIVGTTFHVKQDLPWTMYNLGKFTQILIVIYLVAHLPRRQPGETIKKTNNIAIIIYLSGVLQAIVGIWQFHVQHSLGMSLFGEYIAPLGTGGLATIETISGKLVRAYGTFPHPNILGAFLVLALILGYYLIVSRETWKNWLIFILVGDYLLIMGIFFSFSRVSWAICIFASFSFLWYIRERKKWLILAILLPMIVSCATIFIFSNDLLSERVTGIQSSNSYVDRKMLNEQGIKIFKANPFFGVGLGNYIPKMREMIDLPPWEYQPSHNIFIYIAASTGIAGLGLFLWFSWHIFVKLWNSPNSDLRFVFLLLGISFLFMSNFDHFLVTIQQGQLMLALVLGMIAGYDKFQNQQ